MKNKFILLCGPSYSGKSTFAKEHLKDYNRISFDDILHDLAKENQMTYSDVFKNPVLMKIANYRLQDTFTKTANQDVYVDMTNLSVKTRAKHIRFSKGRENVAIYFEIPDEATLNDRMQKRNDQYIPKNVVTSMNDNYVKPLPFEGFDRVFSAKEYVLNSTSKENNNG